MRPYYVKFAKDIRSSQPPENDSQVQCNQGRHDDAHSRAPLKGQQQEIADVAYLNVLTEVVVLEPVTATFFMDGAVPDRRAGKPSTRK